MAVYNESSCIVQAQWEWCTSDDSGRWGRQFQAYRYRQLYIAESSGTESLSYGYSVITTRNKIRGKGRALSFRFSTEPFKNLHLLGWNIEMRVAPEP